MSEKANDLLISGRTSIFENIFGGIIFVALTNIAFGLFGITKYDYSIFFQFLISFTILYFCTFGIFKYKVFSNFIIKKYYTKIGNNLIQYDDIEIIKVRIGSYNGTFLRIYFKYSGGIHTEIIKIENSKKLKTLIDFCYEHKIPVEGWNPPRYA